MVRSIAITDSDTQLLTLCTAWILHLTSAVPTCHELPMMHVSVLSVEQNLPWTFIAPQTSAKPPPVAQRPSSKERSNPFFVDVSSLSHALFPRLVTPLSHSTYDSVYEPSFIPDTDELPASDNLTILPLSTTTVIRTPADQGYSSISMLHIHLLHSTKSPTSSFALSNTENHREITFNYHELAVLAAARWRLDANPILPLHLGALEVMNMVLGRGDVE